MTDLSLDTNKKPGRARRWISQAARCYQLYLMILPAVVSVFIFHYIPIYGVQIAFKNFRTSLGIAGSPWVGFDHFIRFFQYREFWAIMRNTIGISLYSLALFPIEPIFALMINEVVNTKLKKAVQMLTYAPHFVSMVVVCSMTILFLDRSNGVINNVIEALGGVRRSFISEPNAFATIYVISGVWKSLGWGTIIFLSALAAISPELYEAARIDGASRFQIVKNINVPSLLPTVVTLFILRTGQLMNVGFEKIFLLQNTLNLPSSRVISTYVYNVGLEGGQYSYASAIGLFNNVINIIFVVIVNAISKRVTQTSLW